MSQWRELIVTPGSQDTVALWRRHRGEMRSWAVNYEVARRLGVMFNDVVTKNRLRYRRVTTPWGNYNQLRPIVIIQRRNEAYLRYWVSFGPDKSISACGMIEKLLGIRMQPGELRMYEVEARSE